jgi:hypothetical protein
LGKWLKELQKKLAIWYFRKAFSLKKYTKKKEDKTNDSEI